MKIKLKKGLNLSIAGALADNAEIVGSQSSAFAAVSYTHLRAHET